MKSEKRLWLRFLPNALINVALVALLGLLSIAVLDLEPDYLGTWEFYITSGVLTMIFMTAHWSSYDERKKRNRADKAKQEELRKREERVKVTTETIEWVEHRAEFIHNRNQNKKIEAWVTHIQNKLTRLTNRAKERDRLIEIANVSDYQRETLAPDVLQALQRAFDDARGQNTYCKRKRAYASKIEPKWIAENINKIQIEYDEIDVQFIETGSIIRGVRKSRVNEKGKYAKDNLGNRALSTLLTVFISVFAINDFMAGFSVKGAFMFAIRLLLLTVNIVMGNMYGDDYYRDVDCFNVASRVSICGEFKQWGLAKGFLKKDTKGEN